MLRLPLPILALLALTAAVAAPECLTTFKGEWFAVRYPASFKAVPSDNAASFLSPDGQAEFYVYSPQWRGQSPWLFKRAGEKAAGKSTQSGKTNSVTYLTFRAPGYTRAYADYQSHDGTTRWGLGIKYKSQSAYNTYRPLYLKFKQSLKQYAD